MDTLLDERLDARTERNIEKRCCDECDESHTDRVYYVK